MLVLCNELKTFLEDKINHKICLSCPVDENSETLQEGDMKIYLMPESGTDRTFSDIEGKCNIRILLESLSSKGDEWADIAVILQKIRLAVLSLSDGILSDKFLLAEGEKREILRWRLFKGEKGDRVFGEIKMSFYVPVMTSEIKEVTVYGEGYPCEEMQ